MLVFVIVFHFILLFIIYIFFHFIYLYFCHLFLALKLEFPFGGSKPVCICSLDGNTNVKMLETCRHCHTNEREHWSDRPCLVFILCSLLVTPVFLLTEPVALRCSIKRSSPKNSAKPTSTGKQLRQTLFSNKEEISAHVFFRE